MVVLSLRVLRASLQLLAALVLIVCPCFLSRHQVLLVVFQVLVKLCAAVTLGTCLPAMAQQLLKPSSDGLLRCMACSAFAFFLFSYQVSLLARARCSQAAVIPWLLRRCTKSPS